MGYAQWRAAIRTWARFYRTIIVCRVQRVGGCKIVAVECLRVRQRVFGFLPCAAWFKVLASWVIKPLLQSTSTTVNTNYSQPLLQSTSTTVNINYSQTSTIVKHLLQSNIYYSQTSTTINIYYSQNLLQSTSTTIKHLLQSNIYYSQHLLQSTSTTVKHLLQSNLYITTLYIVNPLRRISFNVLTFCSNPRETPHNELRFLSIRQLYGFVIMRLYQYGSRLDTEVVLPRNSSVIMEIRYKDVPYDGVRLYMQAVVSCTGMKWSLFLILFLPILMTQRVVTVLDIVMLS